MFTNQNINESTPRPTIGEFQEKFGKLIVEANNIFNNTTKVPDALSYVKEKNALMEKMVNLIKSYLKIGASQEAIRQMIVNAEIKNSNVANKGINTRLYLQALELAQKKDDIAHA
ncbi:MAG: hypothetical protein WCX97_02075 [Candidatus Magasanikbacteria bacterium]